MLIRNQARCIWPIENPDLDDEQLQRTAVVDLPRICAENRWVQTDGPRDWRVTEGVDERNQPTLYLTCVIDIERVIDVDSAEAIAEAPLPAFLDDEREWSDVA